MHRPKPSKRRRIKTAGTSDSDSDKDPDSQGSPGKAGRKNIRAVIRDKQVADDTKQAAKEEEERLKRIAERQKLVSIQEQNLIKTNSPIHRHKFICSTMRCTKFVLPARQKLTNSC